MVETELRILDGATCIGGNKILLRGKDGGIFLDFGVNVKRKREYMLGYRALTIANKLYYYLYSEILPRVGGIYRDDLMSLDKRISEMMDRAEQFEIDKCVISHAHIDHYGAMGFLSKRIGLAVSNSMKIIMDAVLKSSGASDIEAEVFHQRDRRSGEKVRREVILFKEGARIPDLPFNVIPYPVDHSLPASFGFLIEDVSLAYTGDIRMHGFFRDLTEKFAEMIAGVDYLLIEGTRINSSINVPEEEVSREIERFIEEKQDKLVSIVISPTDIDRLRDLMKISEKVGRKIVLSPKIVYLIDRLSESPSRIQLPSLKDVGIYLERRSLDGDGYNVKSVNYRGWMKNTYMDRMDGKKDGELVRSDEIGRLQGRYLLVMSGLDYVLELAQINPSPGSRIIVSTSEPHDEEQEIEWSKFERWVNMLRLDLRHVHSSGHADRESLIEIINSINPRKLIPIHTLDVYEFKKLRDRSEIGCEIILPKIGEPIRL